MDNQLKFWENYPEIQEQLIAVNKIIQAEIGKVNCKVGQALRDSFAINGKLLRPALVLLFAKFSDQDKKTQKRMLNVAASVELLHNATLIHDDIIDESQMRRGVESIQAKYGKHVAVYAGDYLFALCFKLLSDNGKSMKSLQFDGKTMQGILGGELQQLDHAYDLTLTKEDYLNQINGKTGLLFGLSCFLGTYESGQRITLARKAAEYGELMGQAFQIKDDILDYTVTAKQLKKPVLLDVKNGIYSGPLLFALEHDNDQTLRDLVQKGQDLTSDELLQIERLVNELGGVREATELADELSSKSIKILQQKFPEGKARKDIEQLTEQLLSRTY